jgi:hypothetical protein
MPFFQSILTPRSNKQRLYIFPHLNVLFEPQTQHSVAGAGDFAGSGREYPQ